MQDRAELTVRAPKALVRKIDERTKRKQREYPKWSRNDEIVALLERGTKSEPASE